MCIYLDLINLFFAHSTITALMLMYVSNKSCKYQYKSTCYSAQRVVASCFSVHSNSFTVEPQIFTNIIIHPQTITRNKNNFVIFRLRPRAARLIDN